MRKQDVILGLFLLLALAACHAPRREARQMPTAAPGLAAIDSLSWAQPDSALALLLPWFDTRRADTAPDASDTTLNRHYANLLLAELLYKNDYAQTNRPALRQAVAYLDSLAGACDEDTRGASAQNATPITVFLAARAHYLNGVGHYETDSVLDACQEYMKAVETMDEWFDEKDLIGNKARFMALAYTHLTSLFSDQYLHEQSLYFGKEALEYYNKYDATAWHKAWILNEIGSHYDIMENYDSAYFYYCKGLAVLEDTNNLTYRDIATRMALLSYRRNGEAKAPLNQMHNLLAQTESENELVARYSIIGEILYHEQQFDSAYSYLKEVFDHTESFGLKKQAAERLMEICTAQDRKEEGSEYAMFLAPFANKSENQSHLKSQLTEFYHIYGQNKLKIEHRQQMRKFSKYGGAALVVLAAIALLLLVFHFVNKKRYKHLRKQNEEKDRLLESERHSHKMKQAALAGRLKRSNETLRQAEQKLKEVQHSKNALADGKTLLANMAAFKASPVCRHIFDVVEDRNFKPKIEPSIYKNYALDKSQLKALVEAADEHLNHFTVRIRKVYPALNEDDVKYCCLFLLGLNEADISALMQRAYSTVCERNRKIKRIMGTEGELKVALMEWV